MNEFWYKRAGFYGGFLVKPHWHGAVHPASRVNLPSRQPPNGRIVLPRTFWFQNQRETPGIFLFEIHSHLSAPHRPDQSGAPQTFFSGLFYLTVLL
jgi:hypothetical protein